MTKHFSMKLSDEEYDAMKKEAEASGMSMKEVLFKSIQAGTLADGARLDEAPEHITLEEHGKTLGKLHADVERITKESRSWLGGYDYERAAKGVALMYEWKELSGADMEYLLGFLKYQDINSEREPEEVLKELTCIAETFHVSPTVVKGYYRRISIDKDKETATLED